MQYTASRQKEIIGLLEKGVFKIVIFKDILSNTQTLKSHFVDKIKNLGTDKANKKSRLVIQAYNDPKNDFILIQSLII